MNNAVELVGRLTQDPEVRYTQTGKAVISFTLAVNRPKARPEDQDVADYISIVAWERLAELAGNNLRKGARVKVEGPLQVRSYETSDGQKRRVYEVIAKQIWTSLYDSDAAAKPATGGAALAHNTFGGDIMPFDDIPF